MTDFNHRAQRNRKPVNQRHSRYHNGYAYPNNKQYDTAMAQGLEEAQDWTWHQRVGKTDYLDKSLHGWGRLSTLADKHIGAGIGNDFSNGHRGMARAVRGAKKFVRSRFRFHEKLAVQRLVRDQPMDEREDEP